MTAVLRPLLFVDTSAWLAVNEPREKLHAGAAAFYKGKAFTKYSALITTNLVVAEAHASLIKARGRDAALRFIAVIGSSSRLRVIHSTRELEEIAAGILVKYKDEDFSLCDAVSFAVMKEMGIKEVFAFDRHFETAGFRRLP